MTIRKIRPLKRYAVDMVTWADGRTFIATDYKPVPFGCAFYGVEIVGGVAPHSSVKGWWGMSAGAILEPVMVELWSDGTLRVS